MTAATAPPLFSHQNSMASLGGVGGGSVVPGEAPPFQPGMGSVIPTAVVELSISARYVH